MASEDQEAVFKGKTDSCYDDAPEDMTYGRKLANTLSKYKFYYPHARKEEYDESDNNDKDIQVPSSSTTARKNPSLETAWEYFEHIILPRCYVHSSTTNIKKEVLVRAEPGDHLKQTKLYSIFGTTEEDMSDFGIGVGLYFSTIRFLCVICLIAGLMNIPNILYFTSDEYQGSGTTERILGGLTGSAVCTNTAWSPCPTCSQENDFDSFPRTTDRLAYGVDSNGEELIFIKQNLCNINNQFGIISYATMIVVILSIYFMIYTQNKRIITFDQSNDTTEDYSIEITNPPNEARDPKVWKEFFESNFEGATVRSCTIALDNEDLIQALIKRRKLILQLRNRLLIDDDFDSDNLEDLVSKCPPVPTWKKILCCSSDANTVYENILKESDRIDQLSRKEYKVSSVFVIFETEMTQREVLRRLSPPSICRPFTGMEESLKFDGVVLNVKQTEEPSAIRWQDLNVPLLKRTIQAFSTTLVSLILILGGAFIIGGARHRSPELSSFAITILNQLTPRIVRVLTSFESHPNESSYSGSNYIKMTAFRWTNTAVIYSIINPFTDTLQNGDYLLTSVFTMFYFDLLLTPGLGLSDLVGNFKRHYLAPRAPNQRIMNLNFKASEYDIGEMYTNITRVFFFTVFYCTIFPTGYFFATAIFFLLYWVGRVNILRTYCQGPKVSATVSKFTNNFFLLCMLCYGVLASYHIAQFPFDNACESQTAIDDYVGQSYTLNFANGTDMGENPRVIGGDDKVYNFCHQDLLRSGVFPAVASKQSEGSEWMNGPQETFATLYGVTKVVILVLVSASIIIYSISKLFETLFCEGFPSSGKPTEKRFSDVPTICGFIPQVHVDGYQFPFLLCDIDSVHQDLMSWNDPYNTYDFWNLIYDIPAVAQVKRQKRELTTNDAYVDDDEDALEEDIPEKMKISKLVSVVGDWN